MKKVAVIDYGMGNLDSVSRAVEECGGRPIVTNQKKDIKDSDFLILPGVGAFSQGMKNINRIGLNSVLFEHVIDNKIPILGICLGMQLMADKGWEGGETEGLGWIEGEVERLKPQDPNIRIPHVGWNEVIFSRDSPLFKGIQSGRDFYFVHSYHFCCDSESDVIGHTPYCDGFVSAVQKENIFGVQFHPEKSQRLGFKLIRNFLSLQRTIC